MSKPEAEGRGMVLQDDASELRSFTSEKLDILNGLSLDPRITDGEFRIAFRLIQHMNSKNGRTFPSQERLADQTGKRLRTVRACISGLVEKGWLHVSRFNKRSSNQYNFDAGHLNAILDRQAVMNDARLEQVQKRTRKPTKPKFERQPDDGQNGLTGRNLPIVTGSQMTVNTLRITPEDSISIEEERSSFVQEPINLYSLISRGEGHTPFPKQTDNSVALAEVDRIISGYAVLPVVKSHLAKMIMAGTLTPKMAMNIVSATDRKEDAA